MKTPTPTTENLKDVYGLLGSFPLTFGLRAFPGKTFRISYRYSYVLNGEAIIYLETKVEGWWGIYTHGTEEEIRSQLVPIPQDREGDMVRSCKTRTDAFVHVIQARVASNVDPTEVYLVELRKRLGEWIGRIDEELAAMRKKPTIEYEEVEALAHAAE